jgi:hypothetical protein
MALRTIRLRGDLSRRVQPPDAEDRTSGGVGEVTGAIPSPRPDPGFPEGGLRAYANPPYGPPEDAQGYFQHAEDFSLVIS